MCYANLSLIKKNELIFFSDYLLVLLFGGGRKGARGAGRGY